MLLGQFIFFMIKFHKHKKEYKGLKSTISLRFIDLKFIETRFIGLKFIDIRFIDLKFTDIRFIDLKFIDIRFIKLKKHLSGKK